MRQFITFLVADHLCALPFSSVAKIIRAAELIEMPQSPPHILGMINVHGVMIPVADLRFCFGCEEREVLETDYIVITRTSDQPLGLLVDSLKEIIEHSDHKMVSFENIIPKHPSSKEFSSLSNGIILINDLEHLLFSQGDTT